MSLGKGPAEGALLRETEQGGDFAERQLRVLQITFGQFLTGIVQQLLEAHPLFALVALQGARRAMQLAGQAITQLQGGLLALLQQATLLLLAQESLDLGIE